MTGAGALSSLLREVAPGCLMCDGTTAAASAEALLAGPARTIRGAVRRVRDQRQFDAEFRVITADPGLRDLRLTVRPARPRRFAAQRAACRLLVPLAVPCCYLAAMGYLAWLRLRERFTRQGRRTA